MVNSIQDAFDTAFTDGVSSNPDEVNKAAVRRAGRVLQSEVDQIRGLVTMTLQWKQPVALATTANITLSGEQTIDGVLTAASRVLVKNQANASVNGIYMTGSGAWVRAADADTATELLGLAVFVTSGTAGSGKQFVCTAASPITLGTTELAFQILSDQAALNANLAGKADQGDFGDLLKNSRSNLFPSRQDVGMLSDYWLHGLLADAGGNVSAGFDYDGVMHATLAEATGVPAIVDGYLYAVVTESGSLVWGITMDGQFVTGTDAGGVAGAFARTSGGVSRIYAVNKDDRVIPVTFGEADAYGPRLVNPNVVYFQDVAGSPVKKQDDLITSTQLAGTVSAIAMHVVYGQSNGAGGGVTAAISTTAVRSGRAQMFNVGASPRGANNAEIPTIPANIKSLVDLREVPGGRETPSSQIGLELTKASVLPSTLGVLIADHARDGYSYEELKRGTATYANLVASVRRGAIIAGLQGLAYSCRTGSFIAGENNRTDSLAAYVAKLVELQANMTQDLAFYDGSAGQFLMFVDQLHNWTAYNLASSDVPFAQLKAALDNPGKIFCVGPKYFIPTQADGIHVTSEGAALLGAYHGRAARQTLAGTPWVPLYISSAVRTGANIVLTYAGGDGSNLALDTSLVSNPGNAGFKWIQTGGTARSIISVAVTGARQVTVTLDGDPGAPTAQQISYAMNAAAGALGGPTSGPRGNIRDSSPDVSSAAAKMYNWGCHQLLTVN